eukprot:3862428-Prymnesium_polylepis.1
MLWHSVFPVQSTWDISDRRGGWRRKLGRCWVSGLVSSRFERAQVSGEGRGRRRGRDPRIGWWWEAYGRQSRCARTVDVGYLRIGAAVGGESLGAAGYQGWLRVDSSVPRPQ